MSLPNAVMPEWMRDVVLPSPQPAWPLPHSRSNEPPRAGTLTPTPGPFDPQYIAHTFEAGGYLQQALPHYAPRPQQIRLVHEIDSCFTNGQCLLAEAGTGSGKSYAYLAPIAYKATVENRKAIVVTANIALQEQIVSKDLPALHAALPWKPTFGLMKGRQNYLCLSRLSTETRFKADKQTAQTKRVIGWANGTLTGDLSELPFELDHDLRTRFTISARECTKNKCVFYEQCWAERAHANAFNAQVIITNYHLLCADINIAKTSGKSWLLPKLDLVVLDELHDAPDIARRFFGFSLTYGAIRQLLRQFSGMSAARFGEDLTEAAEGFFRDLETYRKSRDYKARLKRQGVVQWEGVASGLVRAGEILKLHAENCSNEMEKQEVRLAGERAKEFADQITGAMTLADPNFVYYLEEGKRGQPVLSGQPINISSMLSTHLYQKASSVIGTSATLTSQGSFDFIAVDVGTPPPPRTRTLLIESPFDLPKQLRLILPPMPDPSERDNFPPAVAEMVKQVVTLSRGRALALFTSYKNLEMAYSWAEGLPFKLLKQGDAPRTKLLEEFRSDTHSVLFGTNSFWAGVDIVGESLSCLVIDKLPFPTPDDPLLDVIQMRTNNSFMQYSIPKAVIQFKQGFGRLIRTVSDKGVVVILDPRVRTKSYGSFFTSWLPHGVMFSDDIKDIPAFLDR